MRLPPSNCLDQIDGGREADVICVRLECQAQHPDLFAFHYPQRPADFFHEVIDAPFIDFLRFLQHRKIHAGLFRQVHECLQIFRQAESAET